MTKLNDSDLEFIQTINEIDKQLVINTYMETMNQLITFIEEYL